MDGEIPYSLFVNLDKVLDNLSVMTNNELSIPESQRVIGEKFHFIPRYIKGNNDNDVEKISQPHRVLFHAVYAYLKAGQVDADSLQRWMRVVTNIVSVKSRGKEWHRYFIRNTGAMRRAIEIISDPVLDTHNIYDSLRKKGVINSASGELEGRLNEEIIKAIQILNPGSDTLRDYSGSLSYSTWKEAIEAAENYSFFNGSIPFLFRDTQGKVDWNFFDTKFKIVKEYFKDKVENDDRVTTDKYKDMTMMKSLISNFKDEDFDEVIWWCAHYNFDNDERSWRLYLYHDLLTEQVHNLLTSAPTMKILTDGKQKWHHYLYLLSNTKLLDFVHENFPKCWIRNYYGHDLIYPSSTGIFLDAPRRDNFMQRYDITISDDYKVLNTGLLYGTDIDFEYKGHNFKWNRDDTVYLLKNDGSGENVWEIVNDELQKISWNANDFSDDELINKFDDKLIEIEIEALLFAVSLLDSII